MALTFSVTWDYRCPFARIVHDHVITGLEAGADWDVTFVPFSLGQVHVGEGETDIWERPQDDSGLLALQAGVVVRDQHPDQFLAVHRGLFDARHLRGAKLDDPEAVRQVLDDQRCGRPAPCWTPWPRAQPSRRSARSTRRWRPATTCGACPPSWSASEATFVRLMRTPDGDGDLARRSVERLVDLVEGWPDLNEFKHTSIPR